MTASFSAPSATTVIPRLWPRSIVERTMTSSCCSVSRSVTKLRSIFSSVTGSLRR